MDASTTASLGDPSCVNYVRGVMNERCVITKMRHRYAYLSRVCSQTVSIMFGEVTRSLSINRSFTGRNQTEGAHLQFLSSVVKIITKLSVRGEREHFRGYPEELDLVFFVPLTNIFVCISHLALQEQRRISLTCTSLHKSRQFCLPSSLAKSIPFFKMVSFRHVLEQNIGSGLRARRTVLRQA